MEDAYGMHSQNSKANDHNTQARYELYLSYSYTVKFIRDKD